MPHLHTFRIIKINKSCLQVKVNEKEKKKNLGIPVPCGELKWFILWHTISFRFSPFYNKIRKTG